MTPTGPAHRYSIIRAVGRIIAALLLSLFVLMGSGMVVQSTIRLAPHINDMDWLIGAINHSMMLILSVLIILPLSHWSPHRYGFTRPKNMNWIPFLGVAFGLGISMALILTAVPGKGMEFIDDYTLLQDIALIWGLASISEEVFTRGLIQSFLHPLKQTRLRFARLSLSVPVIFSAVVFGAMHLLMLTMGADLTIALFIASAATVLGLVAGYYRETSGSLVPAIFAHVIFNICGFVTAWILKLL